MKTVATYIAMLGLVAGLPAFAQMPETPAEGRILTGWRDSTGTHFAALEITLAPGWKTYWRAPGDAGIPPQFNWSGSQNLAAAGVAFPVPKVMDQNGLRSIGYENSVIFPLALTPKDGASDIALEGEVFIGVCDDICIPYTLNISTVLSAAAKTPSALINSVLADRPMSETEAGVSEVNCEITPTDDGLSLTAGIGIARMGIEEVAVIELSDRSIWVSEADVARSGAYLYASVDMVSPDAQPFALARDDVRITLLGGGQAIDIQGCD